MKITLQYPFTHDGRLITDLTFRRPKVRDLKSLDGETGELDQGIRLIALLSNLPAEAILEMDPEDFVTASEGAGSFLPKPKEKAGASGAAS